MKKILIILFLFLMTFAIGCNKAENENNEEVNYFEEYDSRRLFNCGYTNAYRESENGEKVFVYINKKGEECFNKVFSNASPFDKGVAIVKYEGLYYLLNYKGEFISEGYERIERGFDDIYFANNSGDNGTYLLNKNGKLLYQAPVYIREVQSHYAKYSLDGLIAIYDETLEKTMVIDQEGNVIIGPKYYNIKLCGNGYMMAKENTDSQYILIDKNDNTIIENFLSIMVYDSNIFGVTHKKDDSLLLKEEYYNKKNEKLSFSDYIIKSTILLNDKCYLICEYSDRLLYILNSEGEKIINDGFDQFRSFSFGENQYVLALKNNIWYLYNDKGDLAINEGFKDIGYYSANILKITDLNGDLILYNNQLVKLTNGIDIIFGISFGVEYYLCIYNPKFENREYKSFDKIEIMDYYGNLIGTISDCSNYSGINKHKLDITKKCGYLVLETKDGQNTLVKVKGNDVIKLNNIEYDEANNGYLFYEGSFIPDEPNGKIYKDDKLIYTGHITRIFIDGYFVSIDENLKVGITSYDGTKITDAIYEGLNNIRF